MVENPGVPHYGIRRGGPLSGVLFTRVKAFSYCIGLMDNRFTGLYTNPNIAAYVSVVGLVCIHLMYGKSRGGAGEKRTAQMVFKSLELPSMY